MNNDISRRAFLVGGMTATAVMPSAFGASMKSVKRLCREVHELTHSRNLKFADTYYGEMSHYGLHRLAWAGVRKTRD